MTQNDSILIKQVKAVNLTDSINSNLPPIERRLAIEYLKNQGLNPLEYFTLKSEEPIQIKIKGKDNSIKEAYSINILRIGALREIAKGFSSKIGALGENGDDMQILYDKEFKEVLEMSKSE